MKPTIHALKNINSDFVIDSKENDSQSHVKVGNIDLNTQMSLSSAYYDAAQSLLDYSSDPYLPLSVESSIHPILFLFRHSIELAIKGIIKDTPGHNLIVLLNELKTHLKENHNLIIREDVENVLIFLNGFDERATTFRYADLIKKRFKNKIIDLDKLKKTMRELNVYFVGLNFITANIDP